MPSAVAAGSHRAGLSLVALRVSGMLRSKAGWALPASEGEQALVCFQTGGYGGSMARFGRGG